ncbi:hypothetical protein OKW50_005045 [Paraburkholderia youngii]|uniref:hypothetical protein n=1 Tax=Paraburkholderia youngii TaxID=2782701 RepID=UPI003D1DBF75
MDPKKTANMINPLEYKDVLSERIPKKPVELAKKWDLLFSASVIAVCIWAVIETPLELGGAHDPTALLALVASKVLLGLIGTAAVANLRFARQFFTFICGVGVFALAPALPLEYTRYVAIAIFSTIECIAKAACVASFAIASLAGDSVGVHLSAKKRTTNDQT